MWKTQYAGWCLGLLASLVTLLGSPPVSAQLPVAYVLGPDDVLEVTIWGYPDLTRITIVRPDGKISLPIVGSITAAGVTVERLTQILTRAYASYINNPHVAVVVREFRKIRASVLGQVGRPGTYALPPGSRLLDLLSAAGGLTEAAALQEGRLLRPGQAALAVDLGQVLAGDPEANLLLRGAETLIIPEDLVNIVNVLGEVAKPGRYRLKGDMRVLDVLLLAGGLTERASVTEARLVRASQTEVLGLDRLLLRQEMGRNLLIRAGDTLIIPEETNNKFYVMGDVKTPGVFPLKGRLTLLQAIAMAGGPVQRGMATARTATIVRRQGNRDGTVIAGSARVEPLANGGVVITVDLQAMLSQGNVSQDIAVEPGDVVVMPQSGLVGLQVIIDILAGLATILK